MKHISDLQTIAILDTVLGGSMESVRLQDIWPWPMTQGRKERAVCQDA
jgi:hypothetical protein